jgi:hypothetical protein
MLLKPLIIVVFIDLQDEIPFTKPAPIEQEEIKKQKKQKKSQGQGDTTEKMSNMSLK